MIFFTKLDESIHQDLYLDLIVILILSVELD
jgi:hypothetical protein